MNRQLPKTSLERPSRHTGSSLPFPRCLTSRKRKDRQETDAYVGNMGRKVAVETELAGRECYY
ncbi:uncharacterized protein N7498_008116 [Penicillium cinerascens]|uniref:Uncharacterized protein n=1 Tax=Penicillium cinerascens TaxID=70096 RepID=A0A9W9MAC8_9EURO|nr:uncharacterized protein N7498_008116 [Penicillium cinerascens]KAJ5194678.1 hypothetical protein N7498_008116 [Penicillium cinerascens]